MKHGKGPFFSLSLSHARACAPVLLVCLLASIMALILSRRHEKEQHIVGIDGDTSQVIQSNQNKQGGDTSRYPNLENLENSLLEVADMDELADDRALLDSHRICVPTEDQECENDEQCMQQSCTLPAQCESSCDGTKHRGCSWVGQFQGGPLMGPKYTIQHQGKQNCVQRDTWVKENAEFRAWCRANFAATAEEQQHCLKN
eukprot:gnl/MRDRNA2_/MRDRNA2_205057_c0_seq1.p1 gnl/MRDRNA2_/MRDRNA2_205057_c0~~gnl/MRDRNA2_/MRDRNA2_205057_c0_seq1.p1  ORF type:complete len:201 (+),score=31.37 gnl/MRDRNA2_/MRDRNA2_205057_c0_seq1:137-739(+)